MIILICGWPRAGKTTYSKTYANEYTIFHLDDFGITPYEGLERRISHNTDDIVVEGVYNRKLRRMRALSLYKGEGRRICIWMNTPIDIRRRRSKHAVYDEHFEPPAYDEGWDEIIEIRDVPYIEGISDVKEESK